MQNKQSSPNIIQGDLSKYCEIEKSIKTILKREYPDEEVRIMMGTKSNGVITIISVINFEKKSRI